MLIRFLHVILAGQLFFGTVGIMVNYHICNNKVQSWALFIKAKSCHEENSLKNDCSMNCCDEEEDDEKDGCCDNETEINKLKLSLCEGNATNLKFNQILDLCNGVFSEASTFSAYSFFKYINYKPPLINFSRPVFFQVFLF